MRNSSTRSIEIAANYEKVFDFLSEVRNMPRWATFAKRVWVDDGKYMAETPQGEAEMWIKYARDRGEVDFHWKIQGVEDSAPSRLQQNNGVLKYEFTIQEPLGAPKGTLEQLSSVVDEELVTLKKIAEIEMS